MSRLLSPRFSGMAPYVPGEQPKFGQYIKLNTNENPFPPAKGVQELLRSEEAGRLNLYSDPEAGELVSAISERYGLSREQIAVGNGSDEILAFCFLAFCGPEKGVCYPDITYGFYKVYARLFCLDARPIPLDESFNVVPEDYYGCGRTIFIANPNAPTGVALSPAQIEGILIRNPDSAVIIDEAYVDFGAQSVVPLIEKYDNLIVVQTFSKARNLAGGRVGFAMAQKQVISDIQAMKYSFNPYNLNTLSILAGAAAMRDEAYFTGCTQAVMRTRARAQARLEARGFVCTPSLANFIFATRPGFSGRLLYERLKARGILVRHFDAPRIENYLRITVGTDAQMDALLAALDAIGEEPA